MIPGPPSALYFGRVIHRRLTPRRHAFTYGAFYMLLDIDRRDRARTRLFSYDRFNLLSFHDGDHLRTGSGTLRQRVDAILVQSGLDPTGWTIQILCLPRILGYVFNPLSVYFCHDAEGRLCCLLYEVNNTFGQRHTYVIPTDRPDHRETLVRQTCRKSFYVSPFMEMDLTYTFRIQPPAERVAIGVVVGRADQATLSTLFSGHRRALTDRSILRAAVTYPLLTFKVVAAIHWEALRLWLKGLSIKPRQTGPRESVSFEPPADRGVVR